MKRLLPLAFAAVAAGAAPAFAAGVTIVSPATGATVTSPVTVEVKVEKGGGVDHYHLFVDGEFVKPVTDATTSVPLAPGKHRIKAWATSGSHRLLDASHEIEVNVR